MVVVILNGIKISLTPPDLDGDVKTGGVEHVVRRVSGETNIIQPTELGETLKQLNDDSIEDQTRMSGIDMRARLHPMEVSSVLALDALVSLGVLPTKCLSFSRQKKRLSVSINGRGRDDIVNIVAGKREQDAKLQGGGFIDRMKGMFTPGGMK